MSSVPGSSWLNERRAGILLHPTSLPAPGPVGNLGPDAYRFVDFLAASGVSVWQMLPLGPTHADGSPYQCLSVHAGDPRLIDPQQLVQRGWLSADIVRRGDRTHWFAEAQQIFAREATEEEQRDFDRFLHTHASWLDDYALYSALRIEQQGRAWLDWPPALRDRDVAAMATARVRLAASIEAVQFEQFLFFSQWRALRRYAHERNVLLFGDMPIFVAHDSADVWAQREYFALDPNGHSTVVAGVPPDYFSETGQRWGNPHYDWDRMQHDGFAWWIARMRTQLMLFDLIRIDHFRGFQAFWEIPAEAETAINGHWVEAPGEALLDAMHDAFHGLPLVAEDLGIITAEVDALRRRYDLPGMKILQFAFGGDADNPYLPHNHEADSVVYTGTHDNDVTLSWYESLSAPAREHVMGYLGGPLEPMPWPLIRCAMASVARLAVVPMQDVLGLGQGHRMNQPGTTEGNWRWRFEWEQVEPELSQRLASMVELYGRRVV